MSQKWIFLKVKKVQKRLILAFLALFWPFKKIHFWLISPRFYFCALILYTDESLSETTYFILWTLSATRPSSPSILQKLDFCLYFGPKPHFSDLVLDSQPRGYIQSSKFFFQRIEQPNIVTNHRVRSRLSFNPGELRQKSRFLIEEFSKRSKKSIFARLILWSKIVWNIDLTSKLRGAGSQSFFD